MTKITERSLYNQMIDGTISREDLVAFAEKKIAQLDKRNASAKVRAERKRAEGNEITERVFSVVSTEPQTRDQITELVGDETLSVAKIGARLNTLVKEGRIQKATAKVAGAEGKNVNKVTYFVTE